MHQLEAEFSVSNSIYCDTSALRYVFMCVERWVDGCYGWMGGSSGSGGGGAMGAMPPLSQIRTISYASLGTF